MEQTDQWLHVVAQRRDGVKIRIRGQEYWFLGVLPFAMKRFMRMKDKNQGRALAYLKSMVLPMDIEKVTKEV